MSGWGGDAIVMRTAEFIIMAIVKNDVFCTRASDLTAGEALKKDRAMCVCVLSSGYMW